MKRRTIKKFSIQCFLWLLFFIFIWIFFTLTSIRTDSLHLSKPEILFQVSMSNYQGMNLMGIACIFPFCLSISNISLDERFFTISRYESRGKFLLNNLIIYLIFSFAFAAIHEVVDVFGLIYAFGFNFINENNILLIHFINTFSIFIYYFRISVVLTFFKSFLRNTQALFATFSLYFIFNEIFYYVFSNVWLPCKDLLLIWGLSRYDMMSNLPYAHIFIVLFRGILLCTIVILLTYILFNRKDVIDHEKV